MTWRLPGWISARGGFARRARTDLRPPPASYPPSVGRVLVWYDGLSDWQRVQYAVVVILFFVASGGYLLGLGSAIVLERLEREEAALAAQPLPTVSPTAIVAVAAAATPIPTGTPTPSPTGVPPTAPPTQTPISTRIVVEPPAVPRQVPAAPVIVAPVPPRATPTATRPRSIETPTPVPPRATPIASPVRQATVVATARSTPGNLTPLPTLSLPGTIGPTSATTPAPTQATSGATAVPTQATSGLTPVKTPTR